MTSSPLPSLSSSLSFRNSGQLLQIQLHHRIGKETRVLLCVPLRNIHHVRFQNNGPDLPFTLHPMNRSHRPVISQPMIPADDTKPRHAPPLIEKVQPLRARGGGQPGDDADVPQITHSHGEPFPHSAALDEMLVRLGPVEAPDDGPDCVRRRVDALGEQGEALERVDPVVV